MTYNRFNVSSAMLCERPEEEDQYQRAFRHSVSFGEQFSSPGSVRKQTLQTDVFKLGCLDLSGQILFVFFLKFLT